MAKIFQLTNKIRVILEFMPHFKTVTTGVWIRAGSVNETKKTNGLAHMLEHMIFQGTTTRSAKEICAITAQIGDDLNAYTSEEYTCLQSLIEKLTLPILSFPRHTAFTRSPSVKTSSTCSILCFATLEI